MVKVGLPSAASGKTGMSADVGGKGLLLKVSARDVGATLAGSNLVGAVFPLGKVKKKYRVHRVGHFGP
jgi:hypothetical protein